jgi:CRP-like cAMP-binding protein
MTTIDHFKNSKEFESFNAGQVIFSEGENGHVMYAVQAGEVEIVLKDKVLEVVGEGGIFGEMALIDQDQPRNASAIARTDCRVVPVTKDKFYFLVHETPTFALRVMRIMADRIRRLDEMV